MSKDNKNSQTQQSCLADKCSFFGHYFQQIVAKETKYPNSPTINTTTVLLINRLSNYHLELKPLSKITNEDIIKWAYLIFNSKFEIKDTYQNANDVWVLINKNEVPFFIQPKDCNAMQIDYLRSKGYALPFRDYSVEDLISFGWVRLI